ncbi:MAG: DNA invertase Pin-like site-specific DNA recombinase [Lentimonas sp.]|jgi:DNA invertase Pin-like site-specific DNA recombinase
MGTAFNRDPRSHHKNLRIMLIGYCRISKSDGSQTLNLQHDALIEAGVLSQNIYSDKISGVKNKG